MARPNAVSSRHQGVHMNEPRNPYAPPVTHVADRDEPLESPDSGRFIPYGRRVPAGNGATWIGDAWRLLKAQPGMWAAALILMFAAYMVLSMIPLVSFFVQFLAPFVYAAIALAADEQRRTGTFDLKVLVGGFERHTAPLLGVGLVTLLSGILFLIVMALFFGTDIIRTFTGGMNPDPVTFMSTKFLLAFLIGLAVMLPVVFATYLAPQLIVLHDQPAIDAMKMSLAGTMKNILPGIVFSLCATLLVVVSMIPLLLGLLITGPILAITTYTVYRDIFVED
jgi:hypothetical protein